MIFATDLFLNQLNTRNLSKSTYSFRVRFFPDPAFEIDEMFLISIQKDIGRFSESIYSSRVRSLFGSALETDANSDSTLEIFALETSEDILISI